MLETADFRAKTVYCDRHARCSRDGRISPADGTGMDQRQVDQGFDRLQRLLLAMQAGDEMGVAEAAARSGLAPDTCRALFEGLTRAGLMSNESGDRFVRRHLDFLGA